MLINLQVQLGAAIVWAFNLPAGSLIPQVGDYLDYQNQAHVVTARVIEYTAAEIVVKITIA